MGTVLKAVEYPQIELPGEIPSLDEEEFSVRLEKILERMREEKLDFLLVYGDREHAANVQFSCGIDPRFEEVIVLIKSDGETVLLLGNEDYPYADMFPRKDLKKVLYQSLSLMNQPRDRLRPLKEILAEHGIRAEVSVGVSGWKYFTRKEFENPTYVLEIPSFISETLRKLVGFDNVRNAGELFMHPERGLRAINSTQQFAVFESHATYLTHGIFKFLQGARPGLTEFEAFSNCGYPGIPLSVHPMFSTGKRAVQCGLVSPSGKVIVDGDPFMFAMGMWGSLSARAGYVVDAEKGQHEEPYASYFEHMVKPYFEAVVSWYENLAIGAQGGEVFELVTEKVEAGGISLLLNPGHLIGYDEWLSTPFYANSTCTLRSGMLLQCDLIPISNDYFGSNVEDTVAIADQDMRNQIQKQYPSMWRRIEKRKAFMKDTLGIRIRDEILPFSNIAGALAPFALSPEYVVVRE
jgi:hypothetical protein